MATKSPETILRDALVVARDELKRVNDHYSCVRPDPFGVVLDALNKVPALPPIPHATIHDLNTRFALPIVCPVNGDVVSAETLYNRCCAAMGHVVRDHIGDLILDNLQYPDGPTPDEQALCDAVYAWADGIHKLIAPPVIKRRLTVNKGHFICLETRQPGSVSSSIARDLVFHIEWFSNNGWVRFSVLTDPLTARNEYAAQRKRNRTIRWRLTANNEHGTVELPKKWNGGLY
jgi:hypothetical protein